MTQHNEAIFSVINLDIANLLGNTRLFHKTKTVLGLGNFDGVHVGHQEIVKSCVYHARITNAEPIIVSFSPHPASVVRPECYLGLIMFDENKAKQILSMGISKVFFLNFDHNLSRLPADDFIRALVKTFNPYQIITGDNFFYGHKKRGNSKTLARSSISYGFHYKAINQLYLEGQHISSSLIRESLNSGLIDKVNQMLGRNYSLFGHIIHGKGMAAKELKVPTANILWPQGLLCPMFGVYFSKITFNHSSYYAVTNLGVRPTMADDRIIMLETHILDFDDDIYGQEVRLDLISFLRPERHFQTISALEAQIKYDISLAFHLKFLSTIA